MCVVASHWKELMEKTGQTFDMNAETFTLQNIFAMELHRFQDKIGEIVNCAIKELAIEKVCSPAGGTLDRATYAQTNPSSGALLAVRCASGCVVECRICNREVAGSNLGLGYFAPMSTQPSIPPGSVNEYQL